MVNKVLTGTSFLVVDDDVACVRMTSLILQAHGATVFEATTGAEALQKARANGPTIILADLLMPEMDGWTLVKTIKADPLLRSTPVIAVTASYLTPSDIDHALDVGFAKVLAKPLSIQTLLDAISLAGAH